MRLRCGELAARLLEDVFVEHPICGEGKNVAFFNLEAWRKRAVYERGVDCSERSMFSVAPDGVDMGQRLLVVMSISGCSVANFQISLSARVFPAAYAQNGLRVPSNACSAVAGFQSTR